MNWWFGFALKQIFATVPGALKSNARHKKWSKIIIALRKSNFVCDKLDLKHWFETTKYFFTFRHTIGSNNHLEQQLGRCLGWSVITRLGAKNLTCVALTPFPSSILMMRFEPTIFRPWIAFARNDHNICCKKHFLFRLLYNII